MKKTPVRVPWKNFCAVILSAVILFAFNYSAGAAPSPVEVAVTGIEGEKLDNVRAALDIPSGIVRNGDVNMPWLERFEKQVPDKVKRALEPFGHYDVRTKTRIEKTTDGYVVIVDVSPGRPTLVADVSLAIEGPGAKENRLNRAVDSFPLKKGDVFDHTAYEAGKTQLREAALARAISMRTSPSAGLKFPFGIIPPGSNSFSIRGPFMLSRLENPGGRGLQRLLSSKACGLQKGEPFSYNRIYRTQLNFINSERFREALVEPDKEMAENFMVPITIRLEPASQNASVRDRIRNGYRSSGIRPLPGSEHFGRRTGAFHRSGRF
jgi:translocation and assembly module TamA